MKHSSAHAYNTVTNVEERPSRVSFASILGLRDGSNLLRN